MNYSCCAKSVNRSIECIYPGTYRGHRSRCSCYRHDRTESWCRTRTMLQSKTVPKLASDPSMSSCTRENHASTLQRCALTSIIRQQLLSMQYEVQWSSVSKTLPLYRPKSFEAGVPKGSYVAYGNQVNCVHTPATES